ncbi:MAG TPA: glycosyltransferase family 39 protein [Pyrinomonadaceae bacterium]
MSKPGAGRRRIIIASLIIFLAAFGVRLLSWQDTGREIEKIQTVVAGDYKRVAKLLLEGGVTSFFDSSSPLGDANNLGHPPGYSILLAFIYSVAGERDAAVQLIQITFDALCAVLIFLIVAELLPAAAGFIAGSLAALSPQFAWNSVLLLPDSLAVFPILLAVYLLARAFKRPRLAAVIAAGALIGISCWLRANALLLAPFLAFACLLIFERGRRVRYASALLAGTILVIAPLTIRNAIVFHHFIPLSLGAGQTFLEGIADYDREGRFGVPATDMGIMKWEAENFNRPDYYGTLFNPDGVWRERMRLKQGFAIVRSHPIWFAGVMAKRAASMLRLERARLISSEPPVSHPLDAASDAAPVWANSPAELKTSSAIAPQARASLAQDNQVMELTGDDSKYGDQLVSTPFQIRRNTDYVLTLPVKILRGRMSISVKSASATHASTIVETVEMKTPEEQPERLIRLPFVSGTDEPVQLVIANAAPQDANPLIRTGTVNLYALGAASNTWTRIPRAFVHTLQKLYLTVIMLPLAILGLILLAHARAFRPLVILLIVPAYYLSIQSATHTEYRYILIIHYFLFALAALIIYRLSLLMWHSLRKAPLLRRFSPTS